MYCKQYFNTEKKGGGTLYAQPFTVMQLNLSYVTSQRNIVIGSH